MDRFASVERLCFGFDDHARTTKKSSPTLYTRVVLFVNFQTLLIYNFQIKPTCCAGPASLYPAYVDKFEAKTEMYWLFLARDNSFFYMIHFSNSIFSTHSFDANVINTLISLAGQLYGSLNHIAFACIRVSSPVKKKSILSKSQSL